jgi:hypothetical protein
MIIKFVYVGRTLVYIRIDICYWMSFVYLNLITSTISSLDVVL